MAAARAHSTDMARKSYFDHRHFRWRLRRYRARGRVFGENIAWHTGGRARPGLVLEMWLRSPGHRANLLSRRFTRIGISAATGPMSGYAATSFLTAEFAG